MTFLDPDFAQDLAVALADGPQALSDRLILACEAVVKCRAASFRDSFGLTEIHYRLLAQVRQNAPVTLTVLARNLNRDCGQVSRMVRNLTLRGLIDSGQRRGTRPLAISLTSMGRTTCDAMTQLARDSEEAIESLLPEKDQLQAAIAVERLYSAARSVLGEKHRADA